MLDGPVLVGDHLVANCLKMVIFALFLLFLGVFGPILAYLDDLRSTCPCVSRGPC